MNDFWEMTYGDALHSAIILHTHSHEQRVYFLDVFKRMGEYVQEYDEALTFREYFDMFER